MAEILVGVDRSDASKRAVRFAAARARDEGLPLFVVHVIPWSPYSFNTPGENDRRAATKDAEIKAATEQIMVPALAELKEFGIEPESSVRHGDPVDLVIELAEKRKATEIVVGRTGDSRLKRALFGSIPSHLVQTAPVPVTVVP